MPLFFLSLNFIYGQFIVKSVMFQPTGVSNQGLVVGYETQAGPWSIWKPDSAITVNIGGLAPGNGIGGQAHFSDDGNFLCGTSLGIKGAEMSRYNKTSQHWSVLGSLGFAVDSTVGGGFGISGDGNTVVGLSWADTTGGFAYAHAVAWNQPEGIMDLGSLHDSIHKSTRANAASYNGSVVVGWQDFNGPWKSAVWRKNPAGGYFPNKYLLIDTTGSATDEFNQLGECSSVSTNGIWIGGYGDYANNGEPWIWSKDSGVINLGVLPGGSTGYVSSVDSDGSTVVGWFDGQLFGDPQVPFIWTRTGGLKNLNQYIHNTLGLSTGAIQVYAANCMSSNGKYIAGYGVDTTNFNLYTYRVSTIPTGINEITEVPNVNIYPNPFTSQATIDFSKEEKHYITILDLLGKEIKTTDFSGKQYVLQKEGMSNGIYFVRITDAGKNTVIRKIIIQ